MIRYLNEKLVFWFTAFCTIPIALLGFPTFHGKFSNSLLLLIGCVFLVLYKSSLLGQRYLFLWVAFALPVTFSFLFLENFMVQNILEVSLQFFVLFVPIFFFNTYRFKSHKISTLLDILISLPVPIMFLPAFFILFGLNPFSTNESEITGLFLTGLMTTNPLATVYFALGNSTTLSPALSIIFIYLLMKSYFFKCIKHNMKFTLYLLLACIVGYTNFWFHQRGFTAVILISVLLLFVFKYVNFNAVKYFCLIIPYSLTFFLILFELDNRSFLWREAFSVIDFGSLIFGGGLGSFVSLSLSYSHPHNTFILILFEYGILGLIVFSALLLSYFRFLQVNNKLCIDKNTRRASVFSGILFVCFCTNMTLNSNLLSHEYWSVVLSLILPIKLIKDLV